MPILNDTESALPHRHVTTTAHAAMRVVDDFVAEMALWAVERPTYPTSRVLSLSTDSVTPGPQSSALLYREIDKQFILCLLDDADLTFQLRDAIEAHAPSIRKAMARRQELLERGNVAPQAPTPRAPSSHALVEGVDVLSPREWCAARGFSLDDFRTGLHRRIAEKVAEFERSIGELAPQLSIERRESHTAPVLRIGTRAIKAHTRRPSDWKAALRDLKRERKLDKKQQAFLEHRQPVVLTGDELLVVGGCLHLALQTGGLRQFGPARAKTGMYVFDARIVVDLPPMEEFCRLLGFAPSASGTICGGDRQRVEEAIERLAGTTRPILVQSRERVGHEWREHTEIVDDVPLRRGRRSDGTPTLEIHATLTDGYWWGHLTFDRLPQQWEKARDQIGARTVDDAMKWADLYFRRLVLGVLAGWDREVVSRNRTQLVAAGQPNDRRTLAQAKARTKPLPRPRVVEKDLATAGLLEKLGLEEYRDKQGGQATRKRIDKTLSFARAMGSLWAWKWMGPGALPTKVRLSLPTPGPEADPRPVTVQTVLFPALMASQGYPTMCVEAAG